MPPKRSKIAKTEIEIEIEDDALDDERGVAKLWQADPHTRRRAFYDRLQAGVREIRENEARHS